MFSSSIESPSLHHCEAVEGDAVFLAVWLGGCSRPEQPSKIMDRVIIAKSFFTIRENQFFFLNLLVQMRFALKMSYLVGGTKAFSLTCFSYRKKPKAFNRAEVLVFFLKKGFLLSLASYSVWFVCYGWS